MSDDETALSTLRQKVADAAKTCTDPSLLDLILILLTTDKSKEAE